MNPIEEIFRTLYLPLYPRLYVTAMGLLADSADAADAVQETMVKIWNTGRELREIVSPEAYAFKVLRFTAIDMLRRRSKITAAMGDIPEPSIELSEPDSLEFLAKIVDSLPENQREVVRLSAFENVPFDEISEITGLSPSNVRQLLSRGRKKIRNMYNKYMKS